MNRYDQPSVSQQFKQPSSTSTVALSTASLSTSTKKSDAMHDFSPTNIPGEPISCARQDQLTSFMESL
ncbi:MAG: hypothetical protein ACK5FS_16975 [Planctomycetota bacterium]